MTNSEFQEWLKHHMAKYPGLLGWLHKFPKVAVEFYDPTRTTVLAGWYETLEHVSLEDAKAATDRMKRGEADAPSGFGSTDTAIVKESRAASRAKVASPYQSPKFIDGEEALSCLLCRDAEMPVVTIWSHVSHQAMTDGRFGERFTNYSCVIPCSCERGREYARRNNLPVYDPKRHLMCEHGTHDECVEELRRFCADQTVKAEMASEAFYGEL